MREKCPAQQLCPVRDLGLRPTRLKEGPTGAFSAEIAYFIGAELGRVGLRIAHLATNFATNFDLATHCR